MHKSVNCGEPKFTHDMETKQIVNWILESIRSELTQFVVAQGKITPSLEYEERIVGFSKQFGAGVISKSRATAQGPQFKKKS